MGQAHIRPFPPTRPPAGPAPIFETKRGAGAAGLLLLVRVENRNRIPQSKRGFCCCSGRTPGREEAKRRGAMAVGDLAFKALTAGLGVATLYLAATFSVNVYRGLSWHSEQSVSRTPVRLLLPPPSAPAIWDLSAPRPPIRLLFVPDSIRPWQLPMGDARPRWRGRCPVVVCCCLAWFAFGPCLAWTVQHCCADSSSGRTRSDCVHGRIGSFLQSIHDNSGIPLDKPVC